MSFFIIYGVSVIRLKDYKAATAAIYSLAGLRIVLCMMPQNAWLSADAPLSWGIYRKYSVCTDGINYHKFYSIKSAKERLKRVKCNNG